jgi:dTDP-4-dehydrorhamnose reductase
VVFQKLWRVEAGRHRVSKVLVAGVETVVGGNLAATLAASHSVTGVWLSQPVTFSGCQIESQGGSGPEAVRQLVERIRPNHIVLCGASSCSGWEHQPEPCGQDGQQAAWWIEAAQAARIHFTLVSSAAIFTGPWMFHPEGSRSVCPSPAAACLREIETRTLAANPDSLIVRTHAFGWQPGGRIGWIESLLAQIEQGSAAGLDYFRHSSPILATDLAAIIDQAWSAELAGVFHIAGAERANPVRFARRLAHHFQLPIPEAASAEFLIDRPSGFGCGETSLQTRKIRRALHVSLPMLDEGILRLFQQHVDGYRSRLTGHSSVPTTRVA